MRSLPVFRHHPDKSYLDLGPVGSFRWNIEPVVCGIRKMEYFNQKMQRTLEVPVSATPAVIGTIGTVVASDDGYVRFYSADLAKVYWERRLNSGVYASLVVDPAREWIIVAATSGMILALDLRGTVQWIAETGIPIYATPILLPDSDMLVIAGFRSHCLGLDVGTGSTVFDRALPAPWHETHRSTAAYRDPYASPVAMTNDSVVVCCAEHVLAFTADGSELWRRELEHAVKASPVMVETTGEMVVCTVDGGCHFISTTGELTGTWPMNAKVVASPALSGDIIAVGSQSDVVVGLNIHSREPQWTSMVGGPRSYTSMTVLPSGDFLCTNGRGNVLCLGRDHGQFVWETSQVLGLPEHEPDMDITPIAGPDGNLYCASYSGYVYRFLFRTRNEGEE
ncbi:PQQ-binding-like beta-propeller repeat protein [Nocardia sp. NPDC047648]|uniref:outer membrane protein assembly factor BamB family protein n=1 Tax=Nocardia sp. NPDC047648 TaxID=3155625 RepID=UPI0033D6EDB8